MSAADLKELLADSSPEGLSKLIDVAKAGALLFSRSSERRVAVPWIIAGALALKLEAQAEAEAPSAEAPSVARGQAALTALSNWIDAGNSHRDPEALTLHRLIKLAEEAGEVVTAVIGAYGANPRKGVTNGFDKVLDELLDVAVTALGAYEHIDGHRGQALQDLLRKIVWVADRAGVAVES